MTSVLEPAAERKPEAAGFRIRAAARLIDWGVDFIVALLAAIVLGFAAGLYRLLTDADISAFIEHLGETTYISWIGGAIGALLYHTIGEGVGGATIGKRILGLQVNDVSQQPCTMWQAFKRSLAIFFDGLLFGLVAETYMRNSPLKQRAGDEWAKTAVIKRQSVDVHRSWFEFTVGVIGSCMVSGIVRILTQLAEYAVR